MNNDNHDHNHNTTNLSAPMIYCSRCNTAEIYENRSHRKELIDGSCDKKNVGLSGHRLRSGDTSDNQEVLGINHCDKNWVLHLGLRRAPYQYP